MATKKVIDVSGWQEGIDYDAVVNAGVQGVIIKISESLSPEKTFEWHYNKCIEKGLDWGVYCYSHAVDADMSTAEANEVLYLLKGRKPTMGVWFDFEDQKCLNSYDPTQVCSGFIVYMNRNNIYSGVYASLSTFSSGIVNPKALADYVPYWVAQYASRCDFKDYYPDNVLAGWQYSGSSYIGNTEVDMNEWYID